MKKIRLVNKLVSKNHEHLKLCDGQESSGRALLAVGATTDCEAALKVFSDRGFEVRQVSDGRACLEAALSGKADGKPFDIIILAVDLPVLDGFSTAMLLRDNECARVIVSMTDSDHYLLHEESRGAGCDLHSAVNSIDKKLESLFLAA